MESVNPDVRRLWPAALAALSGSALVGLMPLVARELYADGLSAPSMLFWRYSLALVALGLAAGVIRLDLRQVWRGGAWQIALVGATLGAAQTLCFWESLKTLETSIAVLLFYTYPAVTLALDRLVFKQPIRPLAVFCIAIILGGAGLITLPGLRGGTIDLRGLCWALPSPLVYALYLAINARLLRRHPPLVGAFGLFAGMALTFGLAAGFIGLDVPESSAGWMLLLFIALVPGALTMTLFSVLGEAFTADRAIGGALIVAGILTHALARPEAAVPVPAATLPRLRRGSLPPPLAGEGRDGAPS